MSNDQDQPAQPSQDRRSTKAGIKSGGRRKADRKIFAGGKKGRFLIALSFGVSACIIAWAFTLPFRSNDSIVAFSDSAKQGDQLDVQTVSRKSKSGHDQYVQSMLELERDLKLQQAAKRRPQPRKRPGHQEARRSWKSALKSQVEDAKLLKEVAGGEITSRTIEWQAQQDLKKFLEDVPQ